MSSRLRVSPCLPSYEDQAIVHHIENVERRIRIMCRVSQVFMNEPLYLKDANDDCSDLLAFGEVFHEFVDKQMDELEKLRCALEHGLQWVSIAGLREGEDFRRDYGQSLNGEGER